MPISLLPLSRRQFLAGSVAAGAAAVASPALFAAAQADPDRFALLSDIHIAADRTSVVHGINLAAHLQQACAEILRLDPPPACALINGDCARLTGESGDYATMLELLQPLRAAGIPLHLALGNHDRRDHFWKAVPEDPSRDAACPDRQVLVFESRRANWFMLDSLWKTNAIPGIVGAAQMQWLAKAVDERTSKPAIVLVHHDPQMPLEPATHPATASAASQPALELKLPGLVDTRQLYDVLLPRRHVKALLYGHTHVWNVQQHDGLHLINLPAVSYVFNASQPSAWVDARLDDSGMTLELRCLKPDHPWNSEKHSLIWRK